MRPRWGRLALLIVLALIVQLAVLDHFEIGRIHPEVFWLFPILAGLSGGSETGAVVGFISGCAIDLFMPTPFGLTALVGCVLGFVLGQISDRGLDVVGGEWFVLPLLAGGATAAAVLCLPLLGALLGSEEMLKVPLLTIVAVTSLTNAIIAIPLQYPMQWSLRERTDDRSGASVGWRP